MKTKAITTPLVAQIGMASKASLVTVRTPRSSRMPGTPQSDAKTVVFSGKARLIQTPAPSLPRTPAATAFSARIDQAFDASWNLLGPASRDSQRISIYSPCRAAFCTPGARSALDLPRSTPTNKTLPPLPHELANMQGKTLPAAPTAAKGNPATAYERTRARISNVFSGLRPMNRLLRKI